MHILPFTKKYQRRKMPLRTPRIIALFFLSVLIICYILNAVFRKPARSWYPILYKKETREVFVREWNGMPAKVADTLGSN